MSKWFLINFAVVGFVTWKILNGYIGIHIIFGFIGLLFVFYNWMRHAVYSTIRSNISRDRKIKFAKLTKKVRKYHQWIGSSSLLLIFIHGCYIFFFYSYPLGNFKVISGLLATIALIGVVITGWRRKWKKTKRRHKIHLIFGYTMFLFLIIHLIP